MARALVASSREAALNAVQTFNNPQGTFKAETFTVLMVIAWMYLLHAYYRREKVDYRYWRLNGTRRRYSRTKSGAVKHWDLGRCLDDEACPLDSSTKANLRLLIGLRNEIEHHIPAEADSFLASRFLSTCLNYEYWATELFGTAQSVGEMLSFSLQFRDFGLTDLDEAPSSSLPANVARYVTEFESLLSDDEVNSPRYAYSLLFTRKLTNARGQADRVIEFIAPGSELATQIDNQYWVQKEVERKKFRPSTIVAMMREDGFPRFGMQHHTSLWKEREAKATGKGFGTTVEGTWLWYEPWVSVVRRHCQSHAALYGPT